MIETAVGITLPFPEQISEGYELSGNTLTANIDFSKLPAFVEAFYALLPAPLFLAVHPMADGDEVYYLDGMTHKQLDMILRGYGELLYQDGLSAFAIASHESQEEIYIQKYKIISIYSPQIDRFLPLFRQNGIPKVSHLTTAWDTFSEENPGTAERLEIRGETVEDMIHELAKIGMYLYQE